MKINYYYCSIPTVIQNCLLLTLDYFCSDGGLVSSDVKLVDSDVGLLDCGTGLLDSGSGLLDSEAGLLDSGGGLVDSGVVDTGDKDFNNGVQVTMTRLCF